MNATQPGMRFWLILFAVFWAFYGLTGRDAWKAEEAAALAPVLDFLDDSSRAWQAPAPLHTWLAGTMARLGETWFEIQDGARLASGVFTLSALSLTALAARSLFGVGFATTSVLAMLGCLGLMLRMHALAPETALLATWSALLAGVALGRSNVYAGGGLIGLALLAMTLGLRGLPDLVAGLAIVLLPLLSREWRQFLYFRAVGLGLGLFSIGVGGALAYLHGADLLDAWWRWHGQFPSLATRSRALSELFWFAWPVWPLALAAIWHEHRRLGRAKELHLPILAVLVALLASQAPAWSRDGSLFPLIPPLALLAAYGVSHLKRGAAQGFYWFGVVCFLFFIFAFWLYFAALEWGVPVKLSLHMARLVPNYQPGAAGSILLPLLLTGLWLIAIPLFPRATIRPVLVWASGMVLMWTLLVGLYRPWAEAGWGYRPLIADLGRHLPAGACLKVEVDPAMRTMLRYHLHPARHKDCPWLLTTSRHEDRLVWEGVRPRQKQQRYRLYHLEP